MYYLLLTIPACSFCNIRGNRNCCFIFAIHEHTFHLREKNCLTYKYPLPTLLKADKFPVSEIQNTTYKLH